MLMEKSYFGKLKDGSNVYKYHLKSKNLRVNVLNYGGIITEVYFGESEDNLVLGFSKIEDYEERSPHFGCITGRVAGRIKGAKFKIDEVEYNLAKNNNGNCLHGGVDDFSKKIWDVREVDKGIEMHYISKHLEEGFPGEVEFFIRYELIEGTLRIDYRGVADRKTYVNLTNHSYFNLSGRGERIYNHSLEIDADYFLQLDKDNIPTGIKKSVEGTPFDRRNLRELGDILESKDIDIQMVGQGIDHPFVLNKSRTNEIELYHKGSKRRLVIRTSNPSVVIYTGNFLEEVGILGDGAISENHLGICLETQDFPNQINGAIEEIDYIMPSKEYRTFTEYSFSVEKE